MSLLAHGDIVILLDRLMALTKAGKIPWSVDIFDDFEFNVVVGDFYYLIRSVDQDNYAPYLFEVHRAGAGMGSPVVSENSSTTEEDMGLKLVQLYQAVRNNVHGLDHLAQDILSSLDALESTLGDGTPELDT